MKHLPVFAIGTASIILDECWKYHASGKSPEIWAAGNAQQLLTRQVHVMALSM